MKLIEKKDTTSKIIQVFILDSSKSNGSGLTGLVYNSAGLTAYYIREGAASTTVITLVNAVVGTYTSSGFKEVDVANMPGIYELHLPNACFATGAEQVVVLLKGASNMAQLPIEIQLRDNIEKDIYDRIPSDLKDVPTDTELDTAHGSGAWTPADVSTLAIEANIEGHVTNSLNTYDPPKRSEATSDKNEILTDHTLMKQTSTGTYNRDTDSLEAIRDNQTSSSSIATAVWSKQLSDLTVSGSIGNYIKSKLLSVAKFLALK